MEVGGPVTRCASPTRPGHGERDLDILRAIPAYRGLRNGKDADFGAYARVLAPSRVRVGDPVDVLY